MSLSVDEERLLLALLDEDVDLLYAQWRSERIDDCLPVEPLAPVIPIGVAKRRRTAEQTPGLSGAGSPSSDPAAPDLSSAPLASAEPYPAGPNDVA